MSNVVAIGDGRAPTILTAHGARAKTDRCRDLLEAGSALLVELYRGRAHEALGYGEGAAGWQAYVAGEFGDIKHLRIEVQHRRELVAAMHADGFGREAIRDSIGYGLGTVQRDLEAAGVIDLTAKRAAREARREQPVVEPPVAMSKRDRAVQLVAEQGGRGLTALELAEVTGWTGGSATGTMSDLARQRRVTRTSVYRRGYAAYLVTLRD